jgi:tRNA-dihydrouridine synthase 3
VGREHIAATADGASVDNVVTAVGREWLTGAREHAGTELDASGSYNTPRKGLLTSLRKGDRGADGADGAGGGPARPRSRPRLSLAGKVYIAPLTTVGNLPFRRVMKRMGADVTCGEMAVARNLVSGGATEWSLVRRHSSEDLFGVQLVGSDPRVVARAAELIERECHVDFIDLNCGCPIDMVCQWGAGSALLDKPNRLRDIADAVTAATGGRLPLGIKVRTGYNRPTTHTLALEVQTWRHCLPHGRALAYLSVHGRSRAQRYSDFADYEFIHGCAARTLAAEKLWRQHHPGAKRLRPIPLLGNGDVMCWDDWRRHLERKDEWTRVLAEVEAELESTESRAFRALVASTLPSVPLAGAAVDGGGGGGGGDDDDDDDDDGIEGLSAQLTTCMIGRGALIKPWLPQEIKRQSDWDISGSERFDILRDFANFGLEHWGSDSIGLERTRRFMLEWLSFTCRYVPLGIMDAAYVPQTINDRPPRFRGRDDRETLLGSFHVKDWIAMSEMLLGKAPPGFRFEPKHKSNSYAPEPGPITHE